MTMQYSKPETVEKSFGLEKGRRNRLSRMIAAVSCALADDTLCDAHLHDPRLLKRRRRQQRGG